MVFQPTSQIKSNFNAKASVAEGWQWLRINIVCVAAAVTYGILHDQVTARICLEYFTIGHSRIIASDDPTRLGLVWGIVATWWVGVMLGMPLATLARVGSLPRRSARTLIRPIGFLLAGNALFAALCGGVAYCAARHGWIRLPQDLAEQLSPRTRVLFLTDLWAHRASYTGGYIGGLILMVLVLRSRWIAFRKIRLARQ